MNVPRRRFGCHLPVVEVEFAKFVMHKERRSKTSFSYIRPPVAHEWNPLTPNELTNDGAKIDIIHGTAKTSIRKLWPFNIFTESGRRGAVGQSYSMSVGRSKVFLRQR